MGIEVKNLVKTFDKKTIIDNISFKVDDGKILSIIGFSGSGKSTTIPLDSNSTGYSRNLLFIMIRIIAERQVPSPSTKITLL